jgi:hypothetical protein
MQRPAYGGMHFSGAACVCAPGVIKLVMNGDELSHLPDKMIAEILD